MDMGLTARLVHKDSIANKEFIDREYTTQILLR
jgi:hypothetical protein